MKPQTNNPSPAPDERRKGKLGFVRVGMILTFAALAVYAVVAIAAKKEAGAKSAAAADARALFVPVQRGDLKISLLVPGTIKTRNSVSVVNMLEGIAKIIWVIPEGTLVKKGDKLVELEADGLDDKIYERRTDVLRSEADYNNAEQEFKLQEQDNKSMLITGQNALEVAALEVKRYKEGTSLQDQMTKQTDITLADLELQRAQEKVGWTKKLVDKGYVSSGELKTDELEVKKNEIDLAKAKNALSVFDAYEVQSETLKLVKDLNEAQAELDRTKQDNQYKLKSKEIAVESAKAELDHEKNRLTDLEQQKSNTVLYAPTDGMVVYSSNSDRWNNTTIEVGADLRNRQKIIDLPDFSSWQVEARVHESVIQQVKTSQTAFVSIDAFNGSTLNAMVSKISVMPDSGGRWFSADVKEYIVNLQIDGVALPLKPGMTSKNEIILDQLKSVLFVPIQAVSSQNEQTYVMLRTDTGSIHRDIKVGKANDRFVEVQSGLSEGDQVMLMAQAGSVTGLVERPSDKSGEKGDKSKEKNEAPATGDANNEAPADRVTDAAPQSESGQASEKKNPRRQEGADGNAAGAPDSGKPAVASEASVPAKPQG